MYFAKSTGAIVAFLDDERNVTAGEVLEALAYSADVDYVDVEGPVCLGNDYAQYEFTALLQGEERTFALGPIELRALNDSGEVVLEAYDDEPDEVNEQDDDQLKRLFAA